MDTKKTPKKPKKGYSYSLYQDGVCVVKVFSYSKKKAEMSIQAYNNQYSEDGPTKIIRRRAK